MASVDFFLKIEGIEGESTDDKHKKEIDLQSWSWGESNAGSHAGGGGGGAGKVSMSDFSFTMHTCVATPKLMLACANGEHLKGALLTCRKAGKEQQEYVKIKMSDLLISSFQIGGAGGSDVLPMDSVSLNFSKIEFEYYPQKADGTLGAKVPTWYDLKLNKGG